LLQLSRWHVRAVRTWGLQLLHRLSFLGDELLRVVYLLLWLLVLMRLYGVLLLLLLLLQRLRRLRRGSLLNRSGRRRRYLLWVVVMGHVLRMRLKLRLKLCLRLELGRWRMVLVRAVDERLRELLVRLGLLLLVLVLALVLRMKVVHGSRVGVCLVRLRVGLGMGSILRH
jgi:hypothetical protein